MEEKHKHVWCACVWQHSHAQHGNELSRIRLSLIEQGLPWGKHMFVKMWRVWDKWVLIENLLTVRSLKWSDKIRRKEKNWLSPLKCSPLGWDCNTSGGQYLSQKHWWIGGWILRRLQFPTTPERRCCILKWWVISKLGALVDWRMDIEKAAVPDCTWVKTMYPQDRKSVV